MLDRKAVPGLPDPAGKRFFLYVDGINGTDFMAAVAPDADPIIDYDVPQAVSPLHFQGAGGADFYAVAAFYAFFFQKDGSWFQGLPQGAQKPAAGKIKQLIPGILYGNFLVIPDNQFGRILPQSFNLRKIFKPDAAAQCFGMDGKFLIRVTYDPAGNNIQSQKV
jgi:hypothetical protein